MCNFCVVESEIFILSNSIATGEALVVCVVVSCPEPRPLRIRPKKSKSQPLVTGDEQIDIVSDSYHRNSIIES